MAWVREKRSHRPQQPPAHLAESDTFLTALQYFSGRLPPAVSVPEPTPVAYSKPHPVRKGRPLLAIEAPPSPRDRSASPKKHAQKRIHSERQAPRRRMYEDDVDEESVVEVSRSDRGRGVDYEDVIARAVERAMDRHAREAPAAPLRHTASASASVPRPRTARAPNEELWWNNPRQRARGSEASRPASVAHGRWGNATSALPGLS